MGSGRGIPPNLNRIFDEVMNIGRAGPRTISLKFKPNIFEEKNLGSGRGLPPNLYRTFDQLMNIGRAGPKTMKLKCKYCFWMNTLFFEWTSLERAENQTCRTRFPSSPHRGSFFFISRGVGCWFSAPLLPRFRIFLIIKSTKNIFPFHHYFFPCLFAKSNHIVLLMITCTDIAKCAESPFTSICRWGSTTKCL